MMRNRFILIAVALIGACLWGHAQTCTTNSLRLSTGYDQASGMVLPVDADSPLPDPYWVVVSDNDSSTTEMRPAYVIPPHSAWAPAPSSAQWLGWYPDPEYTTVNSTPAAPIVFEYRFCVNTGINPADLSLSMQLAADNEADVYLNNALVGTNKSFEAYTALRHPNPVNNFIVGTNVLQVRLRNTSGKALGFVADGTIDGPAGAFNAASCCQSKLIVTGTKFLDVNANVTREPMEPGIPSWPITIKTMAGTFVASTKTDRNGYFVFSNTNVPGIVAGNYIVEEGQLPGFVQTTPAAGASYSVSLSANLPVTKLNFGNTVCCTLSNSLSAYPAGACAGDPLSFGMLNCSGPASVNYNFQWSFGDGGSSNAEAPVYAYPEPGTYIVTFSATSPSSVCPSLSGYDTVTIGRDCCVGCLPSFKPFPKRKYVLGAWVSEETYAGKTTFVYPAIYLSFATGSQTVTLGPYKAKGNIIDGWQRIDEIFTVPANASNIKVELRAANGATEAVYFDDIRIHPFDADFKSYVYDPVTLRFVAELDNNNYATFYEYDEEGKLVRVKKETERRTVTIKESRNSSFKKQ